MARIVTTIISCDRCKKAFDPIKPLNLDGSQVDALTVLKFGLMEVCFGDLCPKCDSRVDKLIAAIALERDDKEPADEEESSLPEAEDNNQQELGA